jgi:hypothetical protein
MLGFGVPNTLFCVKPHSLTSDPNPAASTSTAPEVCPHDTLKTQHTYMYQVSVARALLLKLYRQMPAQCNWLQTTLTSLVLLKFWQTCQNCCTMCAFTNLFLEYLIWSVFGLCC